MGGAGAFASTVVRDLDRIRAQEQARIRREEREAQRAVRRAWEKSNRDRAARDTARIEATVAGLEGVFECAVAESLEEIIERTLPAPRKIPFEVPEELASPTPAVRPREDYLASVRMPSLLAWFSSAKRAEHRRARERAGRRHDVAVEEREERERRRVAAIAEAEARHERAEAESLARVLEAREELLGRLEQHHRRGGIPPATDLVTILGTSLGFGESLDEDGRVEVDRSSGALLIDLRLPEPEIVPAVERYRFVKKDDAIVEKLRSATALRRTYRRCVSGLLLSSIDRAFRAGGPGLVRVQLRGWRVAHNPAVGRCERFCAASLDVSRADWRDRELESCDPVELFRDLKGKIAAKTEGFSPVRPHRLIAAFRSGGSDG